MVGYRSSATGQLIPLEFQQGGQVRYVPLPVRVRVSGADAFLGAALAGLGIIQAPRYRMDPYIARGQLVELLPDAPPTPSPLNLVYRATARRPHACGCSSTGWPGCSSRPGPASGRHYRSGTRSCPTAGGAGRWPATAMRLMCPGAGRRPARRAAALGSTNSNTVPVSSDATLTLPPCACAIARVIASPSPHLRGGHARRGRTDRTGAAALRRKSACRRCAR